MNQERPENVIQPGTTTAGDGNQPALSNNSEQVKPRPAQPQQPTQAPRTSARPAQPQQSPAQTPRQATTQTPRQATVQTPRQATGQAPRQVAGQTPLPQAPRPGVTRAQLHTAQTPQASPNTQASRPGVRPAQLAATEAQPEAQASPQPPRKATHEPAAQQPKTPVHGVTRAQLAQSAQPTPPATPPQESERDRQLRRMNAGLSAALGVEVAPGTGKKQRTQSQMKALKKERRKKRISIPLILLCVLIILVGGGYGGFQYLKNKGRQSLLEHKQIEGVEVRAPEEAEMTDEGATVKYKGKTYRRNEDVISILALGVDEKSANPEEHVIGENGQADTLFVAALDTFTGEMTLINISRDSIVDVDLFSPDGQNAGTEPMQICLAYAYGDGGVTSCENTIKSVSRLMYGMPIDAYGSITVPAISVLNDAIGGVEVTVLDDIGKGEKALVKGQKVTLTGEQVRAYVIDRELADKEGNNARMARQRQYLIGFINKAFSEVRRNPGTVFTLYDAVRSYMTTDLTPARLTYLATLAMDGHFREQDIRTVPGEVTVETGFDGQPHAAYHVDDEALYEIILDVYYTEV